eukprot:scaffold17929_cov130-Isochrysis_galbana.AAC.6
MNTHGGGGESAVGIQNTRLCDREVLFEFEKPAAEAIVCSSERLACFGKAILGIGANTRVNHTVECAIMQEQDYAASRLAETHVARKLNSSSALVKKYLESKPACNEGYAGAGHPV